MTLDEVVAREGIRRTLAAYTVAGDRLRIDDFVATFTEDGVLETEGVAAADLFRCEGRAAIGGWIGGWAARTARDGVHRATFARHHLSTCAIEIVAADDARARTYWTAFTDIGPDHGGYYLDRVRRIGGDWLIAHRRIREDWRSPASLFGGAVAATRQA